MTTDLKLAPLLVTCLVFAACSAPEAEGAASADASAAVAALAESVESLPPVVVYKSPTCGCCNGWVEHLRAAGFEVEARDVADLVGVKRDAGVPASLQSCHTGIVDGYIVEGHVPAEQVARMLAERPEIAGLAVPGMPVGSPGMEGPNPEPYQVLAFDHAGRSSVWAEVDPR